MEQTETTEQNLRVNFKQTSKGFFYCEWTVRADTIENLKKRNEELKKYILMELDILNGDNHENSD